MTTHLITIGYALSHAAIHHHSSPPPPQPSTASVATPVSRNSTPPPSSPQSSSSLHHLPLQLSPAGPSHRSLPPARRNHPLPVEALSPPFVSHHYHRCEITLFP
ncbi:unnamed protein product [Linum trigynum]|uniref:Uncharacterized protein n=1 Tax=Linum trigynum TaxID=586398 RepID=A0AAV2GN91_9ROSI